jgi:hypothetical protein
MSNLFAFNQAQESTVSFVRGGHYDAEQQVWIADETSYAYDEMPIDDGGTKEATGKVTGTPQGGDWEVDGKIDWSAT